MRAPRALLVGLLLALLLVTGCGGGTDGDAGTDADADTSSDSDSGQRFPDVTAVEVTGDDDGTYTFDVTLSSPYDSPERYADGWRILDPDGEVLGEMTLGHDHAAEQPFTRSQSGVEIPDGVTEVTVEGHDTDNGYGGGTADAEVP